MYLPVRYILDICPRTACTASVEVGNDISSAPVNRAVCAPGGKSINAVPFISVNRAIGINHECNARIGSLSLFTTVIEMRPYISALISPKIENASLGSAWSCSNSRRLHIIRQHYSLGVRAPLLRCIVRVGQHALYAMPAILRNPHAAFFAGHGTRSRINLHLHPVFADDNRGLVTPRQFFHF